MQLENKIIALFVADMYNELEFWYPYYRMKEEGAQVVVIGPEKDVYNSKHGISIKVDTRIADTKTQDYHGLIIPGGYAPDFMRRNKKMINFVMEMYDEGKIIAAICHAAWMLASSGIIKGKTITSFYSIKDDMINAGAHWVDKEVVVDGTIITSRNPDDLPMFCKAIINSLGK